LGTETLLKAAGVALIAISATACRQDMHDQPKYTPLRQSDFFADGRASRPVPGGTVARGQLRDQEELYSGKLGGKAIDRIPFPVTRQVLLRGQERFNIFCAPCHDRLGNGLGMAVRRGFRRPPSYHTDRVRQLPVGEIFDVITNGFGAMPDYSAQVPPEDRWAIVAYIRVLQYSQNANIADVPPEARGDLGDVGVKK
jgi:Cytochrome C oxidase, cbb3-type, subunit III